MTPNEIASALLPPPERANYQETKEIFHQILDPTGFLITRIPYETLLQVRETLQAHIGKDARSKLAGNIEKELECEALRPLLTPTIAMLTKLYLERYRTPGFDSHLEPIPPGYDTTNLDYYTLDMPWVNFQKKHEFNPPHRHPSVFSYSLWVQIPYEREKEHAQPHVCKSNHPVAGDFQFTHTSVLGSLVQFTPIIAPGYLIFFPSALTHQVHPFSTTDAFRISVAGNVVFRPAGVSAH